jgi:NAD(P)-dependent dehydrogenase (short-subunit alcohol dehydrogenase family)
MSRLEGRVAIVTGGAGGIGSATGRLFCESGARVVLVDLPDAPLDEVAHGIRQSVPRADVTTIAADVGQEAAAADIVRQVMSRHGGIDVLVNNAGIRAYEPLGVAQAQTWEKVLSVNLLSYAYLAREALPALRGTGRGSIVNVSSTHAVHPRAGMGQYDVAKAGILSMTRTLAYEEACNGVRVNAVCPGLTLTPFHVRRAAPSGKSESDLRAERVDVNLLQRWADPREVAFPILWLASDEASFVTASTLMVDGGTRS